MTNYKGAQEIGLGLESDTVSINEQHNDAEYHAYILEAFGAADFEVDARTYIVRAGPALRRLYGFPDDIPISLDDFRNRYHPDDVSAMVSIWTNIREHGQLRWEREFRVVLPGQPADDNIRWLLSRGEAILGPDGELERVRGAAFDITERKRTEEAFRKSQERQAFLLQLSDRLRTLVDPIDIQYQAARTLGEHLHADRVGYAEAQPDGETIVVTRNYTNGVPGIEGQYRYDDYGRTLLSQLESGITVVRSDIAGDDTLTDVEKEAYAVLRLGAMANVPLVKANRLLAVLFVHYCEAHPWSAGDLALLEETADRTWAAVERAQAEAALRVSEEKYRTLFRSMDEGFCILQLIFDDNDQPIDYRYIDINPAFERQTGMSNALGRTIRELLPDIEPLWANIYGNVALTGKPTRFVDHSKSLGRWFDVYAFRVGGLHERNVAVLIKDITGGKLAEAALRESEERFRVMADAVPQIVWITDAQGQLEFFNKQWSSYTGAAYEPTKVATIAASFLHPADAARTLAAFTEARRTCSTFTVEHRIRSAAGEYRWFLVKAEPYCDPQTGEVTRWFGASIDIHDRKLVEAALRASEERLQKAISIETVGIIFFDLEGGINDANVAFQRMSGYSLEDFQHGRVHWDELTPPEFMGPTIKSRNELATKGQNTPYEKQYIRPDGSRWWGLFAGKRISGSECVEFVLDITESKLGQERIRESEARLQTVANVVPDLLWSNDSNGTTDWYNQQWLDYTGQTLNEALSGGGVAAMHPEDRVIALQRFQDAVTSEQPFRVEQRIRRADGVYRWFLIQARPLRDASQIIVRWYGAATDIHEERMALAEAESALRTREQFLSVASHELRTPLTSLLGYVYMLPGAVSQGKGDPLKMADLITRQAQRLNTLIDQMLDVSRLQQGQFAIECELVNLVTLTQRIIDEFRMTLTANIPHVVEVHLPEQPLVVMGDASRLEQVIQNLLSNAIKYSPRGGHIHVRLLQTPSDAVIEVEDHGIGIPTGSHERLFNAFYRAANVGTQISGFGLGLHIVGEIVRRHNGRIEVRSTEGQGSIFRVVLPLASVSDNNTSNG